jgi:hypothetical protein
VYSLKTILIDSIEPCVTVLSDDYDVSEEPVVLVFILISPGSSNFIEVRMFYKVLN